jgi:hypothetical protein
MTTTTNQERDEAMRAAMLSQMIEVKDTLILDLCAALEACANRNRYDGDAWHDQGVDTRRDASWRAAERGYKMLEHVGWNTEKPESPTNQEHGEG